MASISRMRARSGTDERRPRTWRSWSLRGMMASTRRGCPSTPSIYSGGAVLRRGYIRVFKRQRYGRVGEQQQQESCKSCTAHFLLWHAPETRLQRQKRASELRTCRPTTTTSCGAVPCQNRASTAQKADLLSRCTPPSSYPSPSSPPSASAPPTKHARNRAQEVWAR